MNIVNAIKIFMIILMLMICPQIVFAEGKSKSVSDESLEQELRVLRGNKTHAYEGLKNVCKRNQNIPFPAKDRPTANVAAASLNNCRSYELYYGIDQPADPVKARLCAYDEMNKKREDSPHAGIVVH